MSGFGGTKKIASAVRLTVTDAVPDIMRFVTAACSTLPQVSHS